MPLRSGSHEIEVRYLGRVVSVYPAEVCQPYEAYCTITAREREQASPENGWEVRYLTKVENAYWYDEADGRRYFCAFSGFGPYLIERLNDRFPGQVVVHDRRPSGLEKPDMDFLRLVKWRPGQKEVLASILAYRGGQIICDVGFGKTYIINKLARAFPQAKIVVTVPYKQVALEIWEELREDLPGVGILGGGKRREGRVTVAVSHSLKHADRDANLVLADEAHRLLTPTFVRQLMRFTRAKMFAFTATPEGRSDNRDRYLEAIFGPVRANVSYQEAVDYGNVVPLEVVAYDVPDGPAVAGEKDDVKRKRLGLWRNDRRNQIIAQAVRAQFEELGENTQLLITVEATEHAYRLAHLLQGFTVVHDTIDGDLRRRLEREGILKPGADLCTGKKVVEYKKKFSKGEIRHAIATSVWSVGVNFWDLQVLVRADGSPSMINNGQVPGRLSRHGRTVEKRSARVVDFCDSWDRVMAGRWKKRLAVYKDKGWQIQYRELR